VEAKKSFILILEDDETLGLGLKETLSRAGYNVLVASNTDDATDFIRENQIDYLFCDCLLPNGTGLDFIEDVGKIFPQARFKIILMSGIYTDKSFMQEAIKKHKPMHF